jgi:hypothetical protein
VRAEESQQSAPMLGRCSGRCGRSTSVPISASPARPETSLPRARGVTP